MIKRILIVWSMVLSVNSCVQTKKENYAPMDFMEYNGDLKYSAGKNGMIRFRCYYGESFESENPFGNAHNIPIWRYHTHISIYEGSTAGKNRVNPINYFTTKNLSDKNN
jgi:hypothetical protein